MSPSAEPASPRVAVSRHLVPANLLGDGEEVILAIKPSSWFVLIVSLPVLASVAVVAAAAYVAHRYHEATPEQVLYFLSAATALGRLMLGCWQWLGRTYVLTNHRMATVRGLLRVNVTAAPLSKLSTAVVGASVPERLVGIGSIYGFVGSDHALLPPQRLSVSTAAVSWNSIANCREVHAILDEAIRRARRGGEGDRPVGT